jgi:hypothetical protein
VAAAYRTTDTSPGGADMRGPACLRSILAMVRALVAYITRRCMRHPTVWVENGSVGVFRVLRIGKMAPSVAGGSTQKFQSDLPLRSEAVGCILAVGLKVNNGNPGLRV